MVMLRPCCLKCFVMSFLILSAWGPEIFLKMARPSSLYSPMLSFPYFVSYLLRMKRPTSSQISAPSKLPIVTSNKLLSFLIHVVPLLKSSDLRACMMMLVSLSVIVQYVLANDSAF